MIKKVILTRKSYTNKEGQVKVDYQFNLVLDNGKKIRISPYFCTIKGKEWNTFNELMLVSESENE